MTSELRDEVQSILGDAYRIDRELVGGSMARVFVAKDLAHDQHVVVKVLAADLAADVNVDRFRREIQVAQQLDHPRIVPLLSTGQAGELLYYTMPYIEGETLRARLLREPQLPLDIALGIASDVAEALAYAHGRNIVHRDIKPGNVLIDRSGRALVSDFGIARAIEQASEIVSLTSTGHTIGTPTYMSPEQASAAQIIDGRSDIYSLGCVLYEMLAGQPPFTGPTAQAIIARHLSEPPPSLRIVRPQLPESVQRVIEKALAKVPADRYASAERLQEALANPDSAMHWAFARRSAARRTPLVAAVVLATLIAIVAVMKWPRSRIREAADPRRIAVLYFDAPSGDSGLTALGRWLTRDLISSLAAVPELTLTSEAGIQQFGSRPAIDSVVRRLSVGTVVSGLVESRGDSISLGVQLVDASTLNTKGSVNLRFPRQTLIVLRDSVVERVARELRRQIAPEVQSREWRAGTRSDRAWALRQQAQDLIEAEGLAPRQSGDVATRTELLARADSLLALAAAADRRWVEPVIERGWIRSRRASWVPNAAMMPFIDSGLTLAREALGRSPGDARALLLRGSLRYQAWASVPSAPPAMLDSASADLVAATTADSRLARAWRALGVVRQMQGDLPGAVAAVRRALAADVYSRDTPRTVSSLIQAYLFAGQNDSARVLCAETVSSYAHDPTLGPCELTVLGWTGRGTRDIRRTWELVAEMERGGFWPLIEGMSPEARFFAAAVLARSGQRDSAMAVVSDTRRRLVAAGMPTANSLGEAFVEVLLGESDAALDVLERAAMSDSTIRDRAARLPWFTPLQSSPRFRQLIGAR